MNSAGAEEKCRSEARRQPLVGQHLTVCYDCYMERPDDAPVLGQRHTCRNCNEEKPVTPGAWAFKPGGDPLQICLVCHTMRKMEAKAAREAKPTTADGKPKTPREIRGDAKLDIAKALKTGATLANEYVDIVMARVLQYAADPTHRLHGWALEFLAERVMPKKLYEDLGAQAAGVGLGDKRPTYVIQVTAAPAKQQLPEPRVIEGDVVTVEALPLSTNKPTAE